VSGPDSRSARLRAAEEVYFRLSSLPRAERAEALRAECGGDPALLAEVETLLRAGDDLGEFLEQPALGTDFLVLAAPMSSGELPDDLVGRRLGHYRINARIASGGMGTVYEAVREDEFRQRVAIKVVKRGMDTEDILRRFRAERQTLAALNHPNIARLLDGGATPDGRPYLVMEFVLGEPIDAFCAARGLGVAERLRLFRTVCDGVRSAHQGLVVHRDLKPNNILVTPDGTAKLLDFGISKVLGGEEGDLTITLAESRRLTPEYASPEQVRGEAITTASDVYSLGVVLYELLTGVRPYSFDTRSMGEIERVICHAEPTAPSAAVTRGAAKTAALLAPPSGKHTGTGTQKDPTRERLRRRLRGDLDTIVLTALRKDPRRRYASVEQFAGDIDRYLAGLPITAQKDTVAYRVSKFVRRNAIGTSLAATAALCLMAGTAIASWQANRASSQRDQAYQARDDAEAIAEFLRRALEAADMVQVGVDVKVVDVVNAAALRLDADFADRPLTRATVESAIGRSFVALGEYEKAEQHILRAYRTRLDEGANAHDLAESKLDIALLYHSTNRAAEAEVELRDALATHRDLRGERNLDTARVWNDLGAVLRLQNKLDDAENAHRTALSIREETNGHQSLVVAESLNNLSGIHMARKDFDAAEESMAEARRIREALLKDGHPLRVQATLNLGAIVGARGDFARAEPLLREALDGYRQTFPAGHPSIAPPLTSLGNCLAKLGRPAEAEPLLREALTIRKERLREGDPAISATQCGLGRVLLSLGRDDEAVVELAEAIGRVAKPGDMIPARWAEDAKSLADVLERKGRADEASALRAALPSPK